MESGPAPNQLDSAADLGTDHSLTGMALQPWNGSPWLPGDARADGHVAPDATLRVVAALVVAWVATLVTDAGQVAVAIGADDALWPAVWRAAPVVLEACAGGAAVVLTALGVRAAGARSTGAGNLLRD